jgi:Lrp/AsnC family transcriptional regulator
MQPVHIDSVDRKILHLLQSEPGINAAAIGERIGLSQSAVWRRMQGLRDEGIIREQPVKIDREKIGLNTMVFAHVKLTSHGRSNLAAFAEAVRSYPQVLDCYVLLGNVDFLLRIVTEDIKAYEQFFFEKLSQLPGIQEIGAADLGARPGIGDAVALRPGIAGIDVDLPGSRAPCASFDTRNDRGQAANGGLALDASRESGADDRLRDQRLAGSDGLPGMQQSEPRRDACAGG